MDVLDFKIFITVADIGNMSKASEILYISKQAISKRMHKLENELGKRLFEIKNGQFNLTDTGVLFYEHAMKIQEHVAAINSLSEGVNKYSFSIASISSNYLYYLSQVYHCSEIDSFNHVVMPADIKDVVSSIKEEKIDFIIDYDRPEYHSIIGLKKSFIFKERVVAYISKNHSFAQKNRISLSELSNEQLLVIDTEKKWIDDFFSYNNVGNINYETKEIMTFFKKFKSEKCVNLYALSDKIPDFEESGVNIDISDCSNRDVFIWYKSKYTKVIDVILKEIEKYEKSLNPF